ncbi:MAG TPA: acyltransferase domain-containing protein, partial [Longimicrobium sp.]|nr:acyltransferase domain-containing protein [Longimicrobium sp.]
AFDARAGGTVGGSGVALVVLRRLSDALAAGDTVHAVVRGSAVNNDGARRAGFAAPGVDGQAAVIAEALAMAGAASETVGLVEAHGSGTELGDPVELAALIQAFGPSRRRGGCALGAVKTNVGHLDTAAGAAGLIKAALALEHGEIPPTLHFTAPNPRVDLGASPFFINTTPLPWPRGDGPRRAGVSSFGMGGTNAHLVLEEAPPAPPPFAPARAWQLLALSARTPAALEAATERLAAHLRAHAEQALCDVAWTLQAGRRAFPHRRVLVARDRDGAAAALESRAPDRLLGATAPEGGLPVAFLFPGLGNHHPGMGRGLYAAESVYRETVDRCAELLRPRLGLDLRSVLYPAGVEHRDGAAGIELRDILGSTDGQPLEGRDPADGLNATGMAQAALFVTQYALARLWMSWGVRPEAMLGHGFGELAAAAVAGVWTLDDALALLAERQRLAEALPEGGMLGLTLPEAEVRPLLRDGLCISTLNGPEITVVSGPARAIDALQGEMTARGVPWRRVNTRRAFHSGMMAPVAARLEERMRGMRLRAPEIPFVSTLTGDWIRDDQATDPAYWARFLCGTVRFSAAAATLVGDGRRVLLEVGPGDALQTLTRQLPCCAEGAPPSASSLPHAWRRGDDAAHFLETAGRLWAAGAAVDWAAVHAGERLRRVPLPTYPFERTRYWIEPGAVGARGEGPAATAGAAARLYLPTWTRAPLPPPAGAEPAAWLVLADERGIGGRLAERLEAMGHVVAVVEAGGGFGRRGDLRYTARPGTADDLAAVRDALAADGVHPRRIVHLWGVDPTAGDGAEAFARAQARGYATVAALASAFARDRERGVPRVLVVTAGVHDVAGGEPVRPAHATVLGAALTLPHEHPHAVCRTVDLLAAGAPEPLAEQLLAEALADAAEPAVALRGARRWALGYAAARTPEGAVSLRPGGAYLFSGALAGGGDVLAEHLAGTLAARVAMVVSPHFPARDGWDALLRAPRAGDAVAATARSIRAIEGRGGEVLLLRAEPGDAAALGAAVEQAREAFGALHGVVHSVALGASAGLAPLAETRASDVAADLSGVARELAALERATASLPLDFLLLQNSILSVFGAPGWSAATAAFALVDAWAVRRAAEGGRWISASWDRWQAEGDAAAPGAEGAIPREEGARLFEALATLAGEPRVAVSTRDPATRIEPFRAPRAPSRAAAGAEAGSPAGAAAGGAAHAPTNDAEEVLAGIWRELLGRDVGIHDDFFRLGGHSLVGMQLLGRVRETFQVDLPLQAVFEAPTVARLAALIDQAILLELEEMTEEEALSQL